eukprot:m.13507 g.13507  ORF g.13507 m.13507 type:complete len:72 (-) comp10146_c0_seq1:107-322(-)
MPVTIMYQADILRIDRIINWYPFPWVCFSYLQSHMVSNLCSAHVCNTDAMEEQRTYFMSVVCKWQEKISLY